MTGKTALAETNIFLFSIRSLYQVVAAVEEAVGVVAVVAECRYVCCMLLVVLVVSLCVPIPL